MARLIRAAGLRWLVEEDFEFSKDCCGLDQSQVRLYGAIARRTVLVMAALAISAVTAALLRHRTDTQALSASAPRSAAARRPRDDPTDRSRDHPPAHHVTCPAGLAEHWADWRRGHQARSRWYHQRTRLTRATEIAPVQQAKDGHRTAGHPWP
jgi:hypothetical protein